jgi:hypothetical protein
MIASVGLTELEIELAVIVFIVIVGVIAAYATKKCLY